ncbi:MAG: nucleotidyltransferase domain-containing protein [Firmicutes bacterium]|nr:nucleotidyltransferase domain-containing protein [Bacillota bacterium]
MKQSLEERNQKIIAAVLEKERRLCPGAVDLIGISGSFARGDYYDHSDLDLLILIHDERGKQLATAFIQEDLQVGHDLYCTMWADLERLAAYHNPHLAKLMGSRIVYAAAPSYEERLETLRDRVRKIVTSAFARTDYEKAARELARARQQSVLARDAGDLAVARKSAGRCIYCLENALMLLNKAYFRRGVKACYEELMALAQRPAALDQLLEAVVAATSWEALQDSLSTLLAETEQVFCQIEDALPSVEAEEKPPAAAAGQQGCEAVNHQETVATGQPAGGAVKQLATATDSQSAVGNQPAGSVLTGTYEEMFSNWRNKMRLAATTGNRHLAFMSLISFDAMLEELRGEEAVADMRNTDGAPLTLPGSEQALGIYDPKDLGATADHFDALLEEYRRICTSAGVRLQIYPDVDAFISAYVGG